MRRWMPLLLLAGLAACSDVSEPDPLLSDPLLKELEAARERWRAWAPASYTFALERLCFCAPDGRGPVRLAVTGGVVTRRVYVDSGTPVDSSLAQWFPHVDGIFEILEKAIRDGAHQVRATYDPATGVPVDVWIDYEQALADEEQGFRVTEPVVATS